MLRLAKEKEKLSIINDQFGAPTGAELLADATAIAIRTAVHNQKLFGTYHLVASGETTWFDYAQYVFSIAKELGETLSIKEVIGVDTSAYPTPAKRPHNSRLSNKKFQTAFEVQLPDWKVGVKRVEILGK
jgi:dTDP-4-dehydrorhamnose reductase